jgi:tetratricopeptide (TPR) repeat protein
MSSSTNPLVLGVTFVLAGVATVFVTRALFEEATPPTVGTGLDTAAAQRLEALETTIARLEQRLGAAVESSGSAGKPLDATLAGGDRREVGALTADDVRRIVAEVLAAKEQAGDAVAAFDAAAAVAKLKEMGAFAPRGEAYWDELKEKGLLDEVVEAFRELADAQPDSAEAQASYGDALIAKLRRSDNQMDIMRLAARADEAYDEALDINPEHWGARFSKAISYTFWPAITGKPAEAMKHFETLIEQQGRRPAQPEYAMSYLMLGNLHAQRGDMDKAREVWSQGARQYPDNSELRDRLAN